MKSSIFVFLVFWCGTLMAFSPVEALAQISVEQVILRFRQNDPPVRNLTVRNSADKAMLVAVQSTTVDNPGDASEQRLISDNIIVSPKRFSIDAKGERTVRILIKKPRGDTEQVYRVAFAPEARDDDEGIQNAETNKFKGIVRILTGVGILVFVDPTEIKQGLIAERRGKKFFLQNSGNTNVLIDKIQRCNSDGKSCEDYTTRRLYAGNTLEFTAPEGTRLTFKKRYFDQSEKMEIK